MNYILEQNGKPIFGEYKTRINYLCLEFEAKFTISVEGKIEGIQEKVIFTACKFLLSPEFEEKKFATLVLMSCCILLEGKIQCTDYAEDKIILVIFF